MRRSVFTIANMVEPAIFRRRMRETRLARGWSLEQLGRRISADEPVPRAYLSQIERGERNPKIETKQKIAAALGVTVAYLEGTEVEGAAPQWQRQEQEMLRLLGEMYGEEHAADILALIYRLNPERLGAIRALVDSFQSEERKADGQGKAEEGRKRGGGSRATGA